MKKKTITVYTCIILFLLCGCRIYTQGLDELASKTANSILDYFSDKYNVKTSIVNYENFSGISGLTAQRFYQLVVAKLETGNNVGYTDLMINFHQNKGEFNLNQINLLNHLVYIRLIRNKTNIGAGISIFSRTLDKIVYFKYVESEFVPSEAEILDTSRFGFKDVGFSKIVELDSQRDLLDVRSILDHQGVLTVLFLYPEKIDIFKFQENRLVKLFTYKIGWEKPYYPALTYEGRLCVFMDGDTLYAAAGSNFSKYSKFITVKGARWDEAVAVDIDFVPVRRIELNNTLYLAGARYELGKNYFQNKLVLAPFQPEQFNKENAGYLEKQALPFYALDFSTVENSKTLNSIHMIDRDYNYRFFGDNFEQLTIEKGARGSALCSLDGQWLAVSDFSQIKDKLYFYKIENGSRRLVFENKVNGEIVFISDGLWQAAPGFWVYVKKRPNESNANQENPSKYIYTEYKLQFWSKKSE